MKTKLLSDIFLPIAAIAALLCAPLAGTTLGGSILKEAGEFALLGGTSITNEGNTVIRNGDIGLWTGTSITGFPPGELLNGEIRPTGTTTTKPGMDALINAQVGLANMPINETLSNVNLGGLTLEPGVYKFDEGAQLTGDLVLDGKGQNGAFWVFQIGTSLITSVDSTVTMINPGTNGGSDYGVFWNAGAEIVTGDNNALLGNYLSGTSITFGANSIGGGRGLAQAAITLENNDIDFSGGPGVGDWSGGLMYNEAGDVVAIPESATYATIFGLAIFGMVIMRRMRGQG